MWHNLPFVEENIKDIKDTQETGAAPSVCTAFTSSVPLYH